jgi:hypothetical protein
MEFLTRPRLVVRDINEKVLTLLWKIEIRFINFCKPKLAASMEDEEVAYNRISCETSVCRVKRSRIGDHKN